MNYPVEFGNKMKKLLRDEFESFESSYEKLRKRGLRVNEYRISAEDFSKLSPFPLEPIPWIRNGFFYPDEVRPARHSYYAAGLYYLQEPSAMTPASRLPLEAGDKVLDLCAAPGGKATELAERLALLDSQAESQAHSQAESQAHSQAESQAHSQAESKPHSQVKSQRDRRSGSGSHVWSGRKGTLVANDISQQRAKALLHNLEMTGTDNYCVLNETPERLAQAFPAYFDKVLVDAPCSGEGMFRKEEEALRLWSPERVADFAAQQKKILAEAYKMLRPGGMLLYSTCTFAPEENEQQIAEFLKEHPDMELQEIEPYEGFSEGRPEWIVCGHGRSVSCEEEVSGLDQNSDAEGDAPLTIRRCVRIWPHKMDGEGHFLALLKKTGQDHGREGIGVLSVSADSSILTVGAAEAPDGCENKKKSKKKQRKEKRNTKEEHRPNKEQRQLLRDFLYDIVGDTVWAEEICAKAEIRQGKAFLPGETAARLNGLHVMRDGQYLGEWKKNRFEPSQAWAMTWQSVPGKMKCRSISLDQEDPRLNQYLRGESFAVADEEEGWTLICIGEYPVGWAKVVHGVAKNHYPVSWRITV